MKNILKTILLKTFKILSMPHVHFDKLKYYPSFILGKSKNNNPVFLERWDKINFKNLRKLKIKKNTLYGIIFIVMNGYGNHYLLMIIFK